MAKREPKIASPKKRPVGRPKIEGPKVQVSIRGTVPVRCLETVRKTMAAQLGDGAATNAAAVAWALRELATRLDFERQARGAGADGPVVAAFTGPGPLTRP